ncbi:Nif3-like dinuclear metal center hexameric protein [Zophobihabitans entericus]|uniref:GTP cyclohydrolase 1 type 2 homolog n=1 Tax=Zophobihabitans entericus TaxID=1635327 RepID=A0A6G9IDM8_9GAMM|nr:Nif3-like dinuclear metal center hexameric protein [Zophobihabitans entericus]QIQ21922.1 Nif3-like dinuclear metal center hexameric protein [Zophobihabitans entericus]
MLNTELEQIINKELNVNLFKDYTTNGLQVQGKKQIQKIVTGVTACQRLLDAAVELQADAVLVHHGYFWGNEPQIITGMKYNRIKTLLTNDINLLAYHLPLDGHSTLGNNVLLAALLGIEVYPRQDITDLLFKGEFQTPISAEQLITRIEQKLHHSVLHSGDNAPATIKRIAWCSGGGQDYLEQAAQQGFDAFITGEVSERTIHIAREYGLHFFAAGHHATERYGIKALGEWLAKTHQLSVEFVDIDNPA